jgi:FixJ family two-component response regulator
MMPEMDGRELMSLVRTSEQWEKLPVLVISAIIGPKAVGGLLDQGATFFLAKPVKRSDVEEVVERCVGSTEPSAKQREQEHSAWKTLAQIARRTAH